MEHQEQQAFFIRDEDRTGAFAKCSCGWNGPVHIVGDLGNLYADLGWDHLRHLEQVLPKEACPTT